MQANILREFQEIERNILIKKKNIKRKGEKKKA